MIDPSSVVENIWRYDYSRYSFWLICYTTCSRSDRIKQYHDNSCSIVLGMIWWYIHTVCITYNATVRYGTDTGSGNITGLSPKTKPWAFPSKIHFRCGGFCWRCSLFIRVDWIEIRTLNYEITYSKSNHQSNHEARLPNNLFFRHVL